jgi:DNA-3-methyladenine glycosylase II
VAGFLAHATGMDSFTITPAGPFSLRESALFGFGQRDHDTFDGTMRLAFTLDHGLGQAGVAVTQGADGTVHGVVTATSGTASTVDVRTQVARVLSLDHDAAGYVAVGERDPVIARLLALAPGLRPPLFYNAYEAAVWALLANRRGRRAADVVRARLAEAHSPQFEIAGAAMRPLPLPSELAGTPGVPGLDPIRLDRVRDVARAALDGVHDLLAADPDDARRRLRTISGIGEFTAALIVIRALGHTDLLADAEPRLLALVGDLYGLARPATSDELRAIGAAWAPFRTWVSVLVRAAGRRAGSPATVVA